MLLIRRQAEQVSEQQAEMLSWLTKRCHNLQREILRLTTAQDWCGALAASYSRPLIKHTLGDT